MKIAALVSGKKVKFAFVKSLVVFANQCPENSDYGYCQFEHNLPSHLPYQKSCSQFIQCDEYG